MYYYKVFALDTDNLLGVVTSKSFRNFSEGRLYLTNDPKEANLFKFNEEYYRAPWMTEQLEIKGKYPTIDLFVISKEEYEKIKNDSAE